MAALCREERAVRDGLGAGTTSPRMPSGKALPAPSWRACRLEPSGLKSRGAGPPGGRSFLLRHCAVACISFQHRMASVFIPLWRWPLRSCLSVEAVGTFQSFPGSIIPWSHQQIRTKARGNEYQPSNLKRKHKHGWIRRIRSPSGIEVILRRMLKGRKSLTH